MDFEVSKGALCSRYPFYETGAFFLIAVCDAYIYLYSGCHIERTFNLYNPPVL